MVDYFAGTAAAIGFPIARTEKQNNVAPYIPFFSDVAGFNVALYSFCKCFLYLEMESHTSEIICFMVKTATEQRGLHKPFDICFAMQVYDRRTYGFVRN